MKNLSKGEKTYLIYSIINLIVIWCATKNVGVLNEDIAFGLTISWIIYLYSYLICCFVQNMYE